MCEILGHQASIFEWFWFSVITIVYLFWAVTNLLKNRSNKILAEQVKENTQALREMTRSGLREKKQYSTVQVRRNDNLN